MPGPPPKPPEARRSGHVPRAGEWRTAESPGWQHGPVPAPPPGLGLEARRAWKTWFASWVAAFWFPGDVPQLRLVIRLLDQHDRKPSAALATTLRQWMDGYGLTPHGRQQRRWRPASEGTGPEPVRRDPPYSHLRRITPGNDAS